MRKVTTSILQMNSYNKNTKLDKNQQKLETQFFVSLIIIKVKIKFHYITDFQKFTQKTFHYH
jgi:hypothetical protein